jgi:flavin reductase (DIM6/NTAB) family NADH-FMN oxidoreductase RutF
VEARNIMTMGWHTMMSFSPALIGCYIWPENHSYEMFRRSKECVINGLTALPATKVRAPLIAECYANLECRLADGRLLNKYSFFVLEVVKAHAPATPKYPRALHYRGGGVFMVSGKSVSFRRKFKPQNL